MSWLIKKYNFANAGDFEFFSLDDKVMEAFASKYI
jgi:hypothetical protein